MRASFARAVAALLFWVAIPASATTLMVMSVSYTTAQVIINKSAIRILQVGEISPEGVKLSDIQNGIAVLEVGRQTYRLGVGGSTAAEVVLRPGQDGMYRLTAYLNRVPFAALIDTGATNVSMTSVHAAQLGIDYRRGRRAMANTANGPIEVFLVTLPSVQVGDIVLSNVPAQVSVSAQAAQMRDILIGNSFLRHVQMQRTGDTMVLTRGNGI